MLIGVEVFDLKLFEDERGHFLKLFEKELTQKDFQIRQINLVKNKEPGTLRGLHYQTAPFSEEKIFHVLSGKIELIYVDISPNSASYMLGRSILINAASAKAVRIPAGFATGYLTLKPNTQVLYVSDNDYRPDCERGIKWDDTAIGLSLSRTPDCVSDKDKNWPLVSK